MFNINAWKLKLKPTINTSEVRDLIVNLENLISSETLPLLHDITAAHEQGFSGKGTKFYLEKQNLLKDHLRVMKFKFKVGDTQDPLEVMVKLLQSMQLLLPWLRDQFKSRLITTEAIDMRLSNMIQMVELCDFTYNYITDFANAYTHYHLKEAVAEYDGSLTPTIEEKLSDDLWSFAIATTIVGRDLNDIKSAAGRIPAILADHDKFYSLMESVGRSNADPLDLTTPPFPLSLLFMAQVSIANSQLDKLEKAESNAKAVRYRLALAKRHANTGELDAATQRQIKAYEDRLKTIERDIDRMERKYGLKG